jgi:hypothetical protein
MLQSEDYADCADSKKSRCVAAQSEALHQNRQPEERVLKWNKNVPAMTWNGTGAVRASEPGD